MLYDDLSADLQKAQQDLNVAQARITQLEALLPNQPNPINSAINQDQQYDIFDNLMEGCQIIGFDWRYIYMNAAASRHGQRTKAELVGYTMMESYPGIETTGMFSILQQCMNERAVGHMENEFVYPDGTGGWFEISIQPVPEGIFILSLEITERKQSQQDLQRHARRMEILHEIDMGIISAASIQAVVETALKNLREIIGCQRVSVVLLDRIKNECRILADDSNQPYSLSREMRIPIPPGWDEGFGRSQIKIVNDLRLDPNPTPAYPQLIRDGLVCGLQCLLMDHGESIGFLGLNANTIGFFTPEHEQIVIQIANQLAVAIHQMHLNDLMEQHIETLVQKEEMLRHSEARYRSVVEDQTELICRYDTNFRLNFVNGAYAEVHGMSVSDMPGLSILEKIPLADHERVIAHINSLTPSNPVTTYAYQMIMPDHTRRWFQWTIRALMSTSHKIIEYQGVGRDVTERRRAQNELEALYEATAALFSADTLFDLGRQIVETVVRVFEQADCGLMLVNYEQKKIVRLARMGTYTIQPEMSLELDGLGLVPLAIRMGETVYAPDVMQAKNYLPSETRTRSELVVPLKTAKGVIGALDLQHIRIDAFGVRDKRILTAYAERAAAAIENMQLYEEINHHAAELEKRVAQRTTDLNSAKERVEAILNNSLDGILLVDPDFSIQQVNSAFNQMFACEIDEYFDRPLFDLIAPDDIAQVLETIHSVVDERKGKHVEIHAIRQGSLFDVELSIGYFKGAEKQNNRGFVCTFRDITQRKAQERQLRYHASLQENVSDAVIVTDMAFRIQSWNRAAERIYGWSAEQVVDQPVAAILGTSYSSSDEREHSIQSLREQGWWQGEVIQHHKDGSIRHILASVTMVKDESGMPYGVVSVNHDITERAKVETALRESESRYRLLAENVTDVIAKVRPDGIRTFVTPSCQTLLGYRPEELIGRHEIEIVHPDDRPEMQLLVTQAIHNLKPSFTLTQRIRHQSGHYMWTEVISTLVFDPDTKAVVEIIGVIRDITERKQTEEALKESEEKYRSLIETMSGGLIIYDIGDKISYVNERFCELLGYSREDLVGINSYDYMDDANVRKQEAQIARRHRLESSTYELAVTHRDGRTIHLLISAAPMLDKNGQYEGSFSVVTDITTQKQAEETLQIALTKEKELSELKSRFVSMASHEFRTPLATILALTETLSAYRQKLTEDQIDQRFDKIKGQVGYLKGIMEDMLLLAQMQVRRAEFQPTRLDLDDLCRGVLDEFQTMSAEPHHIDYFCHSALKQVILDKKLMRQIISNLISNAIKYSPPSKPIAVSLEYIHEELLLTVKDEGIGIPEADLPYLFEPFHRASNVGMISGTGLGLVITRESVELHGGSIAVESQIDIGASFIIRIPIVT